MGALALAAMMTFAAAQNVSGSSAVGAVKTGICETEAPKLAGRSALRVGKGVPQPRKIRHVNPKYPEVPSGTVGRGPWAGEILIGTDGSVLRVWTIREIRFAPTFPAFNQAIVDAIKQWQFESPKVEGRSTPLCTTVTMTVDWS